MLMRFRFLTSGGGVLLAALLFGGCEDVITVDLKNVEPKLVIEGVISDKELYEGFIITRTVDFYDPNLVKGVPGADIEVSDDQGNTYEVVEHVPGVYQFESFLIPRAGRTYTAAVTIDGVTYTASSTMPAKIRIDSLSTEYQEGGGFGTDEDEGYRLHVYFDDVADRPDYARIRLRSNHSTSLNYYLYDGRYSDGNTIDYEYFFSVFQPGDNVTAELYTLDRTMYDYFLTLDEVWAREDNSGGFLDATPANPNTNWSNGALGYFGVFAVSTRAIEVVDTLQ